MNYMFLPLMRYFDFSGRSRRKEYWLFVLFYMVLLTVAMIADAKLGLGGYAESYSDFSSGGASVGFSLGGGIISLILVLLFLIPSIAVAVRRVHDQDKSGWFILIPIYGFILMFIEGTRGPNRFGPDPKGAGDAQVFS
jgi:uncharacterized membrane protein YhaH (DUF805 family)